jgi:hypothetical protein
MEEFEKLGAFYLGRLYDLEKGRAKEDLLLYDSKDLTTHGVCVGMTGSGKTGLCISLLEEAAIDGIPALAIDPKGDIANMMLTFPELRASDFRPWIDAGEAARKGLSLDAYASDTAEKWRKGLAEWGQEGSRIAKLKQSTDIAIYTPGSSTGLPLSVLRSFDAPAVELARDADGLRDHVLTSVSGLLALLGMEADPIRSREHILLANILQRAWGEARNLDIEALIWEIQSPPFQKVGVFDLESFFPSKERFALAMSLNNLLASPGFAAWMEGEPLEINRLLYSPTGQPSTSIFSIAHLSEAERMFFVTMLLNEVIAWMRTQPGTSSLRALLYMDEIFGYLPPTAAPPSKTPMLTLLKQARAFGLGVVLATQNPVDLDYKALSNAGTWFIGRLQTERDKERVLDGLEGASTTAGRAIDRRTLDEMLSALGQRVFLMHNVHEDQPVLFQTRWALSYLKGPMTRAHIQTLMESRREDGTSRTDPSPAEHQSPTIQTPLEGEATATRRPVLPAGIQEHFLPVKGPLSETASLIYRPAFLGVSRMHFVNAKARVDIWEKTVLLSSLATDETRISWDEATEFIDGDPELDKRGLTQAGFAALPPAAARPESYTAWKKDLANYLYQNRTLKLWKYTPLKQISEFGESERDFRVRLSHLMHERRDLAVEKLRKRYAPKLASLEERLRKAQARVSIEESQYGQQKMQTAVSLGATILGALFGRKLASAGTVGRATTSMRGVGRIAREKEDIARAQKEVEVIQQKLVDLEEEFREKVAGMQEEFTLEELELEEVQVRPRKSDISVGAIALVWTPWRLDRSGLAEPAY